MLKKYEFTGRTMGWNGVTLHQIRACRNFGLVAAGDIGGWIEKEFNLSHDGNAWVYNDGKVYNNARVYDNAKIYISAEVFENAVVNGNAKVLDNTMICGRAHIAGDASVFNTAVVSGDAKIFGDATISESAYISEEGRIFGAANIHGKAVICGDANIYGNTDISGDALIHNNADYATIKGFGTEFRNTTFFKSSDGSIKVNCGCFHGTLKEFRKQVKKTRSGKIRKEYLKIADLMEMHFSNET